MDPNAALYEMRQIVARVDCDYDDAERLADLVRGLDGWISSGGFLPSDWSAPSLSAQALAEREAGRIRTLIDPSLKDNGNC